MLDRELVLQGLPKSMPDKDCRDFVESLNRTKEMFQRNDSLHENHHLLESIDRYLTYANNSSSNVRRG